jgi:hypothetical protein
MLGPVVLDGLGQQQRSAGLDTHGLANLLTSQRQQVAAAMPSGLAEQLSAFGLADAREGVREGATAASAAAGSAAARASQVASVPRGAPAQWPYWVLGLAALAGLAWLFLGNSGSQRVAEQPRPPVTQSTEPRETVGLAPANPSVGAANLADQVTASINALRTTLTGINDAASAEAALPKIREVTAQLDKVNASLPQLQPESRRALAALIAAAMPTINGAIERILAFPGVGDVARPAINEVRTRLDSLARA